MNSPYLLYKVEQAIMPFDDYGAIVSECRRIGAETAIEFGPGSTTLALFEGGCRSVISYEYDPMWIDKSLARIGPVKPENVEWEIRKFENVPVIELDCPRVDIAVVDSPIGVESRRHVSHPGQKGLSRYNTLKFALTKSDCVLIHDAERKAEQATIAALNAKHEMLSRKVARVWL